jgi:hypothetical protein
LHHAFSQRELMQELFSDAETDGIKAAIELFKSFWQRCARVQLLSVSFNKMSRLGRGL